MISQEFKVAFMKELNKQLKPHYRADMKIVGDKLTMVFPKYAEYLEYGTRPHIINAMKKKALRFEIDGKVFYRKKINHPGIAARMTVRKAIERTIAKFE
jgi:hypothetical protein